MTHTTNTSNNNISVTLSGASSAPSYTNISVNPTSTDEGDSVTITVSGTTIPAGTQVWVGLTPGTIGSNPDFDGVSSGAGAGDPYGGAGGGFNSGVMITMTPTSATTSAGTATITAAADQLTEGDETYTATLYGVDSAGIGTEGLNASFTIFDTSQSPAPYTVVWNENSSQWSACQGPNSYLVAVTTTYPQDQDGLQLILDANAFGYVHIISSDDPDVPAGYVFDASQNSSQTGVVCSSVTTTTTSTTTSTTTNAPCNEYYVANTSSWNTASFYCPDCGCDGGSVSINGVGMSSYQQSQNTFCSNAASASELYQYLQGASGSAWVASGTMNLCNPGSSTQGAN